MNKKLIALLWILFSLNAIAQSSENFDGVFVDGGGPDFSLAVRTALPVNFGALEATVSDHTLSIKWSTLFETNNDRFDVEVSFDGKEFTKIGSIKSNAINGSSDLPLFYEVVLSCPAQLFFSIGFVLLGVGAFRQKNSKIIAGISIVLLAVTINACSKMDMETKKLSSRNIYVRVAQVDKDEEISYSKTVKVIIR